MSSHQSDRRHGARPVRASDQAPRPVVSRAQRRLRGLLLLAVVLWLPVSTALAVTGVLMWASVPFAALTLVAVLVWLRTEAQADRARAEDRAEEHAARRRPGRRPAPVLSSDDTQVIQAEPVVAAAPGAPTPAYSAAHSAAAASVAAPAAQAMTPARTGAAASEVAYDVWADEAERARLAESLTSPAASAAEPAAPGTWSPVPVPTPTYAMKAKAHPRLTESGIPADVFDTPEFADEADELDDRALFARRAVSQ